MKTILLSAYNCEFGGVSEAYTGAKWAEMLARRYHVVLATRARWVPDIQQHLCGPGRSYADNITVLGIETAPVDEYLGPLRILSPEYWLYEKALLRELKGRPELKSALDLVIRKVPVSFRFPTMLHKLGVPLVLGPLAGGTRPPKGLREMFRGEGLIYKLRYLDRLPMRSRLFTRYLDAAAVVLVSCDNVREILPDRVQRQIRTLLDTGIDVAETPVRHEDSDEFVCLFVGRMLRYKAPTLAVEGFARHVQQSPGGNSRLVMIGDGPDRDACAELATRLGVRPRVEFTGWLTKKEVLRRFAQADVFVNPSLKEASGNVYLEAMSQAVPLVVVDSGGGHYIPCDECAFKVSPESRESVVAGFAEALNVLESNPERRRVMGERAHAHVRGHYSWDAIAGELYAIVEELTE